MLRQLTEFLNFWSRVNAKYTLLKYDEEKRDTSIRLGVQAIIFSIVGLVTVLLSAVGFYMLWDHFVHIDVLDGTYEFPFFTLIGLILLGGVVLLVFLRTIAYGTTYTVYQFRLNERSVRWVALACLLISVVGMLASVVTVGLLL